MQLTLDSRSQKRILYASLGTIAWLVFSERGLRMRMSDKRAKKLFSKAGVKLNTKFEKIDAQTMHYAWTGKTDRPTIVFLHGAIKSWTYFKDFLKDEKLLERFRLIAIDRPGYGHSGFGKSLRISEQALLIAKLLDTISNNQPVYIVGHSMGAPITVAITTLRPLMVKGIVLAGGALDPMEEKVAAWRKIFMVPPFKYALPGGIRPANREMFYLKEDLHFVQSKYSQVNCPVFLVHAKDDRVVSLRQTKYAGKHFTNAEQVKLISYDKGGHFVPTRKFKEFRNLLLRALKTEVKAPV